MRICVSRSSDDRLLWFSHPHAPRRPARSCCRPCHRPRISLLINDARLIFRALLGKWMCAGRHRYAMPQKDKRMIIDRRRLICGYWWTPGIIRFDFMFVFFSLWYPVKGLGFCVGARTRAHIVSAAAAPRTTCCTCWLNADGGAPAACSKHS